MHAVNFPTAAILDQPGRPYLGWLITIAVHLLILALWMRSGHPVFGIMSENQRTLLWFVPAPVRPTVPQAAAHLSTTTTRVTARQAAQRIAAAPFSVSRPAHSDTVDNTPASNSTTVSPATPELHAEDLMQQARRNIGKIDKDLRKEFPQVVSQTVPNGVQAKLERGIAAAVAEPKWYEAARMEEIPNGSGTGARLYKIHTASGSYCVWYETNHRVDGIDSMQRGIQPKVMSCPK